MNINSNNEIESSIIVNYGDKCKFIFSLEATVYKGNMNLSPLEYKFEPSFQGLFQKIKIYSKSSFNFPLYILSIKSLGELILIFQLQYFNMAFSAKKQNDKFIL
jgi:hypothetical protein